MLFSAIIFLLFFFFFSTCMVAFILSYFWDLHSVFVQIVFLDILDLVVAHSKDQHFVLIHPCIYLSVSCFSALLWKKKKKKVQVDFSQAFLKITMLILLTCNSFFLHLASGCFKSSSRLPLPYSHFIGWIPKCLLLSKMSKLSPCIKYYRSIPWGQNTSALLEWQNLFLSFLQDFCIDSGVELVNKSAKGQETWRNWVPKQILSTEWKESNVNFVVVVAISKH